MCLVVKQYFSLGNSKSCLTISFIIQNLETTPITASLIGIKISIKYLHFSRHSVTKPAIPTYSFVPNC